MRLEIAAVCLIAGGAAYGAWLWQHDQKVAAKTETIIVQRSEKHGAAAHVKAKKAIDAARAPGAIERLRADRETCPDCSR